MSAADKAKEIVQDLTGMWWPEGDEDELREAARAWRTFADDVEDVTAAAHKPAQDVIDNNKGPGIEAFGDFWRKYHHGGKGYLDDVASAARDMAKALDKFADEIAAAKKKIEHELEIAGAVLVAGTALALFTGGISEIAAAGATEAIVAAAGTAGVAVSATVAEIAGTVLATAAIGSVEAITVDVVVAQGGRNLLGDQKGIDLAEMKDAGTSGLLLGGAFGGAVRGARAIGEAGGVKNVLGNMKLDGLRNINVPLRNFSKRWHTFDNPLRNLNLSLPDLGGRRLAMAGGGPVGPIGRPLLRNAQGNVGGLARAKPSGKFPDSARHHVLKGEIKYGANGQARVTGYHVRPGGRDRPGVKVPKITDRDHASGLTRGHVWMKNPRDGEWIKKRAQSTFFPESWTPAQCDRAIRKAFMNAEVVDPISNMWESTYKGIRIQGYYDPVTGHALTGYPVFPPS
ncbi:hypothetical protein OEIGOIKO_07479 [Streptomyces chrestomyceticus JCM 4735]|uniref:Bacterial EndoU nuclease domain-containing protein n=2 Tax=Streptomyces chrestomyceticus TaxID=68185 RepID=A0A7U9Q1G0_9ACTN|nr:EndoU domain-containing protein [Streptomyces chrestomyceticus]GCD39623.1 hypothetical protein OEIGOIKO_07479 [Streptomyces chrestomyceticus JCM 4735]